MLMWSMSSNNFYIHGSWGVSNGQFTECNFEPAIIFITEYKSNIQQSQVHDVTVL